MCKYLNRPEESVVHLKLELEMVVCSPMLVLRIELWSSEISARADPSEPALQALSLYL